VTVYYSKEKQYRPQTIVKLTFYKLKQSPMSVQTQI